MEKTVFEIWIYRAIIAGAIAIIWWVVKRWVGQISGKFDELIKAVKEMAEVNIKQELRIGTLEERANDHSNRIRNLEIKK